MARSSYGSFLTSVIPSYKTDIISLAGETYVFLLIITCVLYLKRSINRRAIRRHLFGIHYKDENEVDRLIEERTPYKVTIIWHNVLYYFTRFGFGLFGLILVFCGRPMFQTYVWGAVIFYTASFSIPLGAHRFFTHRAFKASRTYEIIMMLMHTALHQSSVIHWGRDHRAHHKFVDTDGDPYNGKRGMFFPHVGWLIVERHPDVLKQGRKVDISDLTSNPVLAFQQRHLTSLTLAIYGITTFVPQIFWGEQFWICVFCVIECNYFIISNMILSINSWSHAMGQRPYNKKITASDGGFIRNLMTLGEGYHNFHHTFPYDYRSAENHGFSMIAAHLIRLGAYFGIFWDLKIATPQMIENAKAR